MSSAAMTEEEAWAKFGPTCPYCDKPAEPAYGTFIYPERPELAMKRFWSCQGCDAWVGCHEGTWKPLGTLADGYLRKWRQKAHAAFDPLWRRKMARDRVPKKAARLAGYQWLSDTLGIPMKACHIGMFDAETCRMVVTLCRKYA